MEQWNGGHKSREKPNVVIMDALNIVKDHSCSRKEWKFLCTCITKHAIAYSMIQLVCFMNIDSQSKGPNFIHWDNTVPT